MKLYIKIIEGSKLLNQAIRYGLKNANSQFSQITVRNVKLNEFSIDHIPNEADVDENSIVIFQVGVNFLELEKRRLEIKVANKIHSYRPKISLAIIMDGFDVYAVRQYYRLLSTDALLILSEMDLFNMTQTIENIYGDTPYFSKSIVEVLNNTKKLNLNIDSFDEAILYYLSSGVPTNLLGHYIPLSLSAIEGRKRKLKELFSAEGKGDFRLLTAAKSYNFI